MIKMQFTYIDGRTEKFKVDKSDFVIGRSSKCDIILPYEGFSRQHVRVEVTREEIYLTDLGSTNGVLIEGEKIKPLERTLYPTYLSLQFGMAQTVLIELDKEALSASVQPIETFATSSGQTSTPPLNTAPLVEKKKIPVVLVVLGMVILGGIFWQKELDEDTNPTTENKSSVAKLPPVNTSFIPPSVIKRDYEKRNCEGAAQKFCEALALNTSGGEGLVINGSSIVLYLNLEQLLTENQTKSFKSFNPSFQYEVLLLKRIAEGNSLPLLAAESKFTDLQLVALIKDQGRSVPKMAIKIDRDHDHKIFDRIFLGAVLDKVLSDGQRNFIDHIRPFYRISDFD